MEIIAIVLIIMIGIKIEARIFEKHIMPHVIYNCYFSKKEVMQGESLEIIETVTNSSKLLLPCLKSEISTSNLLSFGNNASTVDDKTRLLASLFTIHGKQKVTRQWHVDTLRRGAFKIEDITLVGSDLFGAYHYSDIIHVNSEVVVLPRPIQIDRYIDRIKDIQGERIVRCFILEDPFIAAGVREYNQGDSMRKIHWGLTARQGELMVRNNETTSKKSPTILFNNQLYREQLKEPVRDERLEYGIRVAAGEMEKTLSDSIPVKLLINGSIDDSNESIISLEMWGKDHVHSLFTILADVKETFTEHFDKFLLHYGQEIQSTEVIIITCYIDDAMIGFARKKR